MTKMLEVRPLNEAEFKSESLVRFGEIGDINAADVTVIKHIRPDKNYSAWWLATAIIDGKEYGYTRVAPHDAA